MLFMMIVKTSKNSEGANKPNIELMKQMDDYNDLLEANGVRVMAKGLHPTKDAMKLKFLEEGSEPTIEYGPFTCENNIAGFFLIEVSSKEEAIKYFLQAPDPQGYGEGEIELRQVF